LVEQPVISKTTDFHLYPQGQQLRLSCAAPKDYQARTFQLYRDGTPILARTNVRDSVAEFTLVNTSMADGGLYACDYRATVAGQEYNSSRSEGILVEIAEDMKVRLVNGSHPCEGRVEVTFGDDWGTVCDDQWGLLDAKVVCAGAGCGAAQGAPTHARFGRGAGPIWLDDVACRGDETQLWHCSTRLWGTHNCHHGEDASAICS
ncbi:scavenger receptor cysteine-rich domain-containing group B protein-like, partial [Chiloscyllium plagiosum]|uniref:scavenger receptor cysteine-rich domain-containing group B protein-like n=1 Tax=Chiloscyllium plagiosum TaxID=36176 RepID=UPI001CB85CC5